MSGVCLQPIRAANSVSRSAMPRTTSAIAGLLLRPGHKIDHGRAISTGCAPWPSGPRRCPWPEWRAVGCLAATALALRHSVLRPVQRVEVQIRVGFNSANAFGLQNRRSPLIYLGPLRPYFVRNSGLLKDLTLIGDEAAIHIKGLPGDIARARRCEEHHHGRDILRVIGTLQRNGLGAPLFHGCHRDALLLGADAKVG